MQIAIIKFLTRSLATVAFAIGAAAYAADFDTVDVRQAQSMAHQGALVIDVREPHEYAEGHAPGSRLIPLGQLRNRINEFRTFEDKPVVLICRSGNRSGQAADMLSQLGFKSVHNVQGGMLAWEKAGLPVEKQ
ncbi:MAG TPA: rhodanese-like domain-containing protein [Noviherbaspirillum sp.]|nr:rhodanese-like domain-containing protein [Noviherbaspirillum sp.]